MEEVKERKVQGNYKGDGFQMGGTFVVAPGGKVFLDKRQKYYGDDASPEEVLAAVRAALGLPPDTERSAAARPARTTPVECSAEADTCAA